MNRRTAMRIMGTTIGLPWLQSLAPANAPARPVRTAFVYIPNGVRLDAWFPKREGTDFDLPPSLEPLAKVKGDIAVFGGLDRAFVPGTGVHAQSGACWLTSSPPAEPRDGGFPTNTTVDQLVARAVGGDTALPSLELSCNDHADNKETKYFESISWYGPGHAANVEKNPRAAFQRIFGSPNGDAGSASVLDAVGAGATDLRRRLSGDDARKLDEYLDSVRSTERRVQSATRLRPAKPPIDEPAGVPEDRGEYIRLMGDLLVLAFQQDLTRVATLVVDPERWDSPRQYHGLFDKPQNHHVLTHTKGDEAREKIGRIDRFHVAQFAHIVERLQAIREGDGTLLDNCAVALGSGISNGDLHDYQDLPVIVAGRAGGRLKTGFYRNYPGAVPLANLWLTLLRAAGAKADRFADSTGPLREWQA